MRALAIVAFIVVLIGILCCLKAGSDDDDINRPND
jgi:hypothetical protein